MSNAKTIKNASTRAWSARANNGATVLQVTLDAVDHAFGESGDWTVLAHHLRKGIDAGAKREVDNIKLVIRSVVPDIKIVADEKQPCHIYRARFDRTQSLHLRDCDQECPDARGGKGKEGKDL